MLLAFTFGGMAFHDVPGGWLAQAMRIGVPFVAGYFVVAVLLDALRYERTGQLFAFRSLGAWAVGVGLGVILRIALEGRPPVGVFVLVTLVFTGSLLLGWRAVYWRWRTRRNEKRPDIVSDLP